MSERKIGNQHDEQSPVLLALEGGNMEVFYDLDFVEYLWKF